MTSYREGAGVDREGAGNGTLVFEKRQSGSNATLHTTNI